MKEINLKPGIKGIKEIIVSQKDSASTYGSGLIDVFATPAMIALMETTAQQSIQKFLCENEITLGIEINVKHLKATLLNKKVICNTELTHIEGKKLEFQVNCFDDSGLIGTGIHKRFIVNSVDFLKKLNSNEL